MSARNAQVFGSQRILENTKAFFVHRDRVFVVRLLVKRVSQVHEGFSRKYVRGSENFGEQGERLFMSTFGLREKALGEIDVGEVGERTAHVGVFFAERCLADGERVLLMPACRL